MYNSCKNRHCWKISWSNPKMRRSLYILDELLASKVRIDEYPSHKASSMSGESRYYRWGASIHSLILWRHNKRGKSAELCNNVAGPGSGDRSYTCHSLQDSADQTLHRIQFQRQLCQYTLGLASRERAAFKCKIYYSNSLCLLSSEHHPIKMMEEVTWRQIGCTLAL